MKEIKRKWLEVLEHDPKWSERINASEHWLKTMGDAVNDYIEKEIVKMKNQIIKRA